jgi:hypothetical protein
MSQWGSKKARLVLVALLRVAGGSHRVLSRDNWPDYIFAFHEGEELAHECSPE